MGWCNVQTNEYDLQARTYPTICTHLELRDNNENKKTQFSRNVYAISDRYDVTNFSGTQPGKYIITMGKVDNDNNMSYRYILSVTYNPIYSKDNEM